MSQDTINVQRGIVGAGSDNDTYILSGNLIDANADITISDVEGANTIQLIGGLSITSSIVAGDTLQLVLSNGAVVTVLGASTMSFEVGGNPLTGEAGVTKDYSSFATDILFTDVPTSGTSIGGTSTVNQDGSATPGTGTGVVSALTTSADSLTGTSESEMFSGLLSTTGTTTTFNGTDSIIDTSTADSDVLTVTLENDVTAGTSAVVRNIETVNINADATTLGGDTSLDFAATNFTGVQNFSFDVTKEVSAVSALAATNVNGGSTVTTSTDFSTVSVTGSATSDNITIDVLATGTTGTPVAVTFGTGTDLTATGAGDLSVTATSTGLLQATAENGLTIDSATSNVHIAEAKAGNVTVANADAAVVADYTATGNVTVNDLAAGKLTVNAGGTTTLTGTLNTTSAVLSATGSSSTAAMAGLTTLNVSGNGAAASYDLTAGTAALNDVTVSGDQDVTLQLGATNTTLNVYDTATAGDFTLELRTAGSVDLTGGDSLVDRLELDVNNTGQTLTVKSGQNVTVTADQQTGGTSTFAVGPAAAEATNALTLTLDDETRDANAVDLDTVAITQAKTVTIDASVDSTSTGSAITHTIDDLTANAANSNVTVTMGANNLILDGAVNVGTGSLTVTGSGTIADATTTLTATTFDASAMTGAVTLDAATINVANVKTGSANDTVVLTNNNGGTFELNAGDDSLTLAAGSLADKIVEINMGEGTDTLTFSATSELVAGTSGTVTTSGIENIVLANGAQSIQGSVLSGQTFNVASATTANTNTVTVAVASTDTAVDLSQLVGSTTTATSISAMTFSTDASANTSATNVTGVVNGINVIAGSVSMDTLTGGTKNDIFDYADDERLFDSAGLMQDTIDGSTGTDSLRVTAATAFTVANTDSWSKISNVESITAANSAAAITLALDLTAQTAGITAVDLSGDGTATGVNVVDASEFTSTITITGASGATAIDTLTGGAGDDTFVYASNADTIATNAFVDTINGGSGTDTLLIGSATTAVDFATADSFARVTNVETIKALASTDGYDIVLNADAWAAGVRTVDLSAADSDTVTSATASSIDVRAVIGGDMTLTGSATGVTTITGGSGADTMTGGTNADVFQVGNGKDIIKFAASAALNGSDTITVEAAVGAPDGTNGADAVVYNFSDFLGAGYSVLGASGIDTSITGIAAAGTADVDITGKLAVIDSVATAGDVDTAAELFALIDGTGDAFALSAGKAVVVVEDAQATGDASDAYFFMIDTTADGASGLSVSDITLVGTAANIDIINANTLAFTTDNFA
jgi:hypothetical protein